MSAVKNILIFVLFALQIQAIELDKSAKENKRGGRDVIFFRNGDLLYGSLSIIDKENGIKWSRTDAPAGFEFTPQYVSEILLSGPQNPPSIVSSNYCTLQLNNGDLLQGVLNGYDGEKVAMETWFGGQMTFPKSSVAMLVPIGFPRKGIFEGPNSLEGWTMGQVNQAAALTDTGQWLYQNHAFYALKSASIARDVHLPDMASFSFDIEW